MVTDALVPLFEKEGIALISPAAGCALVVDDLGRDCAGPVEVVVLAENVDGDSHSVRAANACCDRDGRLRSGPGSDPCRPYSNARSTWTRCRCSRRTSSTVTRSYRWR